MLKTSLTRALGIDHAIIQAGMGGEAGPALAAALELAKSPETEINRAGESSGLVQEILPAAEVVCRTVTEAEALLGRVSGVSA